MNSLIQILNSIEKRSEILRHTLRGRTAIGKHVHSKWKAYSNETSSFLVLEVEFTLKKKGIMFGQPVILYHQVLQYHGPISNQKKKRYCSPLTHPQTNRKYSQYVSTYRRWTMQQLTATRQDKENAVQTFLLSTSLSVGNEDQMKIFNWKLCLFSWRQWSTKLIILYPTAFPYGNGMILHFYQQQESSTTKTVHKIINKRLKTYV